jgi:hypothetical protein
MSTDDRDEQARRANLAEALRTVATFFEEGHSAPGFEFVEDAVLVLRGVLLGELRGALVVAVGDGVAVEAGYLNPAAPQAKVYELAARLQAAQLNVLRLAEDPDEDDEDHTGHGCLQDPELRKSRDRGSN